MIFENVCRVTDDVFDPHYYHRWHGQHYWRKLVMHYNAHLLTWSDLPFLPLLCLVLMKNWATKHLCYYSLHLLLKWNIVYDYWDDGWRSIRWCGNTHVLNKKETCRVFCSCVQKVARTTHSYMRRRTLAYTSQNGNVFDSEKLSNTI